MGIFLRGFKRPGSRRWQASNHRRYDRGDGRNPAISMVAMVIRRSCHNVCGRTSKGNCSNWKMSVGTRIRRPMRSYKGRCVNGSKGNSGKRVFRAAPRGPRGDRRSDRDRRYTTGRFTRLAFHFLYDIVRRHRMSAFFRSPKHLVRLIPRFTQGGGLIDINVRGSVRIGDVRSIRAGVAIKGPFLVFRYRRVIRMGRLAIRLLSKRLLRLANGFIHRWVR